MSVIVWSKASCPLCVQAKHLLKTREIEFEERVIGTDWTREQLLEVAPEARSVPQIFIDDVCIGGFNELKQHLNNL